MARMRKEKEKKIDGTLLVTVWILLGLGLVILYSASAYNGRVFAAGLFEHGIQDIADLAIDVVGERTQVHSNLVGRQAGTVRWRTRSRSSSCWQSSHSCS